MAESDSKSQLAGVIGPALFVAAISVLGYVTYEPSLKSARPQLDAAKSVPPPPTPPGLEALHARLWDDPLVAAYQDSQKEKSKNEHKHKSKSTRAKTASHARKTAIQRDMREVVEGFIAPANSLDGASGQPTTKRVLVMPVFVPGEPFGDDTENRKRVTYAVLSALGVAGYDLKYPDRVSYAEVPIRVDDLPTKRKIDVDLTVPIKLFVANKDNSWQPTTYSAVVVCWINGSQLGSRPLAALRQILVGVFGKNDHCVDWKDSVDLRVIGPDDSETLLQMAGEDAQIGRDAKHCVPRHGTLDPNQFANDFHDPRLLSAVATACQEDFTDEQHAFVNGGLSNSGLTVVRTIGTNSDLACAMGHELVLRGAWPDHNGDGKYVVLVTENDTHYGRSIASAFQSELYDVLRDSPDRDESQLQVFNYLQGIDGKLNDRKKDEPDADQPKTEPALPTNPLRLAPAENDPASGRSQYDYLRRLEDHLSDFHDEKRKLGKVGIVAIGVVGSDVYDKLLVLRALRKQFPRVWFFTTDVDAELSRGNEYPTTRNLLIASHFGLELHRKLQRQAPPFRDCYQTSIFLACLYGLNDKRVLSAVQGADVNNFWLSKRCGDNQSLSPLVFEIGRNGPYQLTTTKDERKTLNASVHPHSPREDAWFGPLKAFFLFVIIFAFLGILTIHSSRTRKFLGGGSLRYFLLRSVLISIAACMVAFLIRCVHRQPEGEPFLILEGISLWPPILIRLTAVFAGVLLLLAARRDLKLDPSTERIAKSLEHDVEVKDPAEEAEDSVRSSFRQMIRQDLARIWELETLLRAFCRWLRLFFKWVRDALLEKDKSKSPFAIWSGFNKTQPLSLQRTIEDYRLEGSADRRAARTFVIWALIVIFGLVLFYPDNIPLQPYRGYWCWLLSNVTLAGAYSVMVAVTAFVVDALWLCRLMIRQLGRDELDWPVSSLVPDDPSRHVMTIRFIARRTNSVGKMAWYPLALLLLVILAGSKTFDLVDLSWPILAIWTAIALLVILTTWQFRRAARTSREAILGRLRDEMHRLRNNPRLKLPLGRTQQAIEEIEREDTRAFRQFTQDPVFASLVIFFGGSGGILLFDQLVPYL